MIVLALLCLVAAAAIIFVMLSVGTDQTLRYSSAIGDFETTALAVFGAGALTLLLIVAAVEFFRRGTKRKVAQRREIKRLRQVEQTQGAPMASGPSGGSHGHAHEETLVRETRHEGPNDRV
ncbi:MAG TPA: hypothetical protein VF661_04365 [Actinomycetales bacterium]|jgi:hypothetical protein